MSGKKEMTLVYYYVPEDRDDPDFPNVFGIMMPKASVRYHHIQEFFPLRGQYIFRFKVMHDNNIVWLDLQDHESKLPTFKDRIFVKATRITWEPSEYIKAPYKQDVSEPVVAPQPQPKEQKAASNVELLSEMSMPQAPIPPKSTNTFMNIDSEFLI